MSEEEKVISDPEESPIEQLRKEFSEQIKTLRDAYTEDIAKRDGQIKELQIVNEDLRRSLIRTTTITPEVVPLEKTSEELYLERVDELSKVGLGKMKEML